MDCDVRNVYEMGVLGPVRAKGDQGVASRAWEVD